MSESIERIDGVPQDYERLVSELGRIIPCYKQGGAGCHADDDDGELCGDGCLMLRIYQAGFRAGRKALEAQ